MTKTASISKGMAKWIEDFVDSLSQDKLQKQAEGEIDTNTTPDVQEPEQQQVPADPTADPATTDYLDQSKTAAINVFDLPKVVWNDETFYVLFDEETGKATILNQFTNVVTTIAARTIEEVDDALNSLQVVTSAIDDVDTESVEDVVDPAEEAIEDSQSEPMTQEPEVVEPEDNKDDTINQMQQQINDLTQQISILQQEYARTTEVQNLDIGAEEAEVQHFNETADQTAQQINEDNSQDITTPQGRSSLRDRLLNDIDTTIDEIQSVEPQEDSQLDLNEEVDQPAEDESGDAVGTDDLRINNIENVEDSEADPITFDTPEVVNEQLYMEHAEDGENGLGDFSNEDQKEDSKEDSEEDSNEDSDEEFEELKGKEANIFKKAVCPCCGGDLVKVNGNKLFQGIVCEGSCHSEYAVNLDNETIFRKRGAK